LKLIIPFVPVSLLSEFMRKVKVFYFLAKKNRAAIMPVKSNIHGQIGYLFFILIFVIINVLEVTLNVQKTIKCLD